MRAISLVSGVVGVGAATALAVGWVIPRLSNQNLCAQSRSPMDIIFQGWSVSLFQASQQ